MSQVDGSALILARRTALRRIDNAVAVSLILLVIGAIVFLGTRPADPEVLPPQALTLQVLPPATVLPAFALCSQHLNYAADGSVSPLTCASDSWSQLRMPLEINVVAWKYFAAHKPRVMMLGPEASAQVVQTAICADLNTSTVPIETSAVMISYIYYRWSYLRFGNINPMAVLTPGGCP